MRAVADAWRADRSRGHRTEAVGVAGADARSSGQGAPASTRLPPAMPSTLLTPRGEANLDVQATGAGYPSRSMGTRATRLGGGCGAAGPSVQSQMRGVEAVRAGATPSRRRACHHEPWPRCRARGRRTEAAGTHDVVADAGPLGGRCTAAELRPHRYGCTIAAGGEACVQSQMRGVEAVYTIAYAGVHLPPRGYRLPCRPHRSLRAGGEPRRAGDWGGLPIAKHEPPGLRDWRWMRGHRAVREVAEPRPQVRMTWSQTQGRWGAGARPLS